MIGLCLGALVGLIICAFFMLLLSTYVDFYGWLSIVICVVILGASSFAGCIIETETNSAYIARHQSAKATIEESLKNEQLSDLTRLDLLNRAVDINSSLAVMQYRAQQWFGFNIPDEVLELEPVNIGGIE